MVRQVCRALCLGDFDQCGEGDGRKHESIRWATSMGQLVTETFRLRTSRDSWNGRIDKVVEWSCRMSVMSLSSSFSLSQAEA